MLFLSLNKYVFLDKLPCSNNLRVYGFINASLINKQLFGFFKPDGDKNLCCSFLFDPRKNSKIQNITLINI